MGWNGSQGETVSAKNCYRPNKSRRAGWLWASGFLLVVSVATIVIFLLTKKVEAPVVHHPTKAKPQEARISNRPKVAVKEQEKTKVVDPNARPTKVGEVVNGYVMLPSGRIHKPTGVITNRVADYGKSPYSIFEHRSDNEIASILMMKPGDTVVGTKRYDKWFTKQFLKSLETPIIVSEDDEPWKADLKRSVIQAKLELKEAYDKGEDIDAIMTESRQQLQDLSRYKQTIKQIYAQNKKECETQKDVEDLQEAVNKMLEQKGCAPMNFTPLTRQSLMKDKSYE